MKSNRIPSLGIGDILRNGGVVLDANERFGGPGEPFAVGIVLCYLPQSALKFVVWKYGIEKNVDGGWPEAETYWGSYHSNIQAAVDDYVYRSKSL